MTEPNHELTDVLEKIYYRDLSDPWDITDVQLRLLDRATGEEIAEIAYKNKWILRTLLVNADTVIDEHNSKVQKKMLRDLKKLTFDLSSPLPREKKRKEISLDSDEVERRLLQETIDEIVEDTTQDSEDEDSSPIDIIEELQRRNINTDRFTLDSEAPSLQRDAFSEAPDNISLQEFQQNPYDVHSDLGIEPFDELNLKQLGQSGMLEGNDGKMIYRVLKNRELNANETEDNQQTPEPEPKVVKIQSRISPKVLEAMRRCSNLQMIDSAAEISINQQDPVRETMRSPVAIEFPEMSLPEIQSPHIIAQAHSLAPDLSNISQHLSRRELFERLATEVEKEVNAKKLSKKGKVRRRQRRVSPTMPLMSHGEEELEIIPPLIRHKRKQRIPKLSLPEIKMKLILDVFDNFDHYVDDDPLWNQVSAPQEVEVSFPEVMLDSRLRKRISTEIHSSPAKRQRTEALVEIDQPLEINDPLPAPRPQSILPQTPSIPTDIELPMSAPNNQLAEQSRPTDVKGLTFLPVVTSTVRRLREEIPKPTADDIELAELRESALPREEIIKVDTIIENMSRSRLPQIEEVVSHQAQAEDVEMLYRCSKGRYQLGTVSFVDFKKADGTADRQSLYAMETVAFYLQIRFILARNQWKMKFTDLLPQLTLLNTAADDKVKESRMWTLADYGFLKLHWDDEEDNIIDVEIITNV